MVNLIFVLFKTYFAHVFLESDNSNIIPLGYFDIPQEIRDMNSTTFHLENLEGMIVN